MAKKSEKPVKLVGGVPAVVTDGHGVGINPENGDVNIVFFQVVNNNESSDHISANGVANVRLSAQQAAALYESLAEAVKPKKAS